MAKQNGLSFNGCNFLVNQNVSRYKNGCCRGYKRIVSALYVLERGGGGGVIVIESILLTLILGGLGKMFANSDYLILLLFNRMA